MPGTQPLVPVTFVDYADESDAGAPGRPPGYPIPEQAKTQAGWIEGGAPGSVEPEGDRHMLIVDRDNRIVYELYRAHWNAGLNRWEAGSGAVFPLTSNLRRPDGWTSADAAGLAILPGLVRYDEAFGTDPIRHAFRVTVRATNGYVFPASHRAGNNSSALPMGARLRLKASVDISGYPAARAARVPGDEDLRADRRRQRQRHVHHRIVRSALGSADGRLRAGLPRPATPISSRSCNWAGRRRSSSTAMATACPMAGRRPSASIPTARPA